LLRFLSKYLHHLLNCIPIASSGGHTEELLDLAEITDRFHLPTIQTEDESVLDGNDLEQPFVVRRQTERERRRRGGSFGQDVDKPR
jgi:hypothetical protein